MRSPGAVLVFSALLCCSCSGEDEPSSSQAGSLPASPSASVRPIEDVLIAQLTLPGDPDWMAADENGVWVQLGSGEVTLIDPETTEVTMAVDIGEIELCQGMGASYGSGWTCLRSDVVRVDPDTHEVVARLAIHKQAQQGRLVGAFDRVWVLTRDGSTIAGIDPETDEVAVEHDLPVRVLDVAASDDALWMASQIDDRVLKVDPVTGEVLLDVEVANPFAVAVDDTEVWVGTAIDSRRLDPQTGEVLTVADAPASPEGRLALDDRWLWVRNADDFLVQVDRATGDRVGQYTAEGVTSGGDVMTLDGDVWVTAYDDQLLFHLDPDRG